MGINIIRPISEGVPKTADNLYDLSNDGVEARGDFGTSAVLTTSGAGTRFIWYPRKAAVRVGSVTGTQWDDTNIGNYSIALGWNNKASNTSDVISGGSDNIASGSWSTIGGGYSNEVTGAGSVISGGGWSVGNSIDSQVSVINGGDSNIISIGADSSIINGGDSNSISGAGYSVILGGALNQISGYQSIVLGGDTINIAGDYSMAIGKDVTLSNTADRTIVFGYAISAPITQSDSFIIHGDTGFEKKVGIQTLAPSARLHIGAGTADTSTAPLKLTTGINLTTPEAGAVEYDGTNLYVTDANLSRKPINNQYILASKFGINMNTSADQSIFIPANKYIIRKIVVTNAPISLTTAAGGLYTAASKGGTAVVAASQVYTSLTTTAKFLDLTLETIVTTDVLAATTLYFSLTTTQGAAATADIYIIGDRLDF